MMMMRISHNEFSFIFFQWRHPKHIPSRSVSHLFAHTRCDIVCYVIPHTLNSDNFVWFSSILRWTSYPYDHSYSQLWKMCLMCVFCSFANKNREEEKRVNSYYATNKIYNRIRICLWASTANSRYYCLLIFKVNYRSHSFSLPLPHSTNKIII